MKNLAGKVVALTGAGDGIGRSLAVALAAEGCTLALSDINEAGLNQTVGLLPSQTKVSTHVVDVANSDQVRAYAAAAAEAHGAVDMVINNAGVTVSGSLAELPYADLEWLMSINFWGVVYGSREFLPYLLKRPEAMIVNMASIHSVFTSADTGPYCTTKFAVRGYTMALAQDLKYTPVRVSLIVPSGIKTDLLRKARVGPEIDEERRLRRADFFDTHLATMTPERASQSIIKGIKRDTRTILVGREAHVYHLLARLFPSTFQRVMSFTPRPDPTARKDPSPTP